MSAIIPFFQWCDNTMLAQAIRNSRVAFPVIENFHLFALTVLLGSLVVLVLRQFGLIYKTQPISEVASALRPWNRWSLAVMLTSGVLLFVSEAMKCYGNTSFRVKMLFLFFALLFQFTIYNRVVASEGKSAPAAGKIAAAVALCLWFGVGLAGRAIGFLG
ncbi:MAG TPA: DUF6644 family protein [Bryobacteraceae bacterium]|jgi:hypothetical protein|nr:DUF6644 family protein [Bryobacteraceae bacterium]